MNRTGPEQKPDNRGDNALTDHSRKSSEGGHLATWRSGYAADCKSSQVPPNIKAQPPDCYQDKSRTTCEPDNLLLRGYVWLDPRLLYHPSFVILSPEGFWAQLHLALAAARAEPPGTLPPQDACLTMHAGLGRDRAAWQAVKGEVLAHWQRDGDRLRFPPAAEFLREAGHG